MLGCLAAAARVSSFTLEPECRLFLGYPFIKEKPLPNPTFDFQGCLRQTSLHV